MAKSLVVESEITEKETVADIEHTNLQYVISNAITFTQSSEVDWDVANGTTDTQLSFPPGISAATALLVRINKAAGSSASLTLRFNGPTETQLICSDFLILVGTNITSLYVSNSSGETVDAKFHFFS